MNTVGSLASAVHTYWQAPVSGNSYRYAGAGGSLYRDWASIAGSLNSVTAPWPMVTMKPMLGSVTYTYFTDGTATKKDDGTTVTNWGIAAPSSQASLALGTQLTRTISVFSTVTGWVKSWTSMTLSTDNTFMTEGTESLKLTRTTAGSGGGNFSLSPLVVDLSTFSDGTVSTNEDIISVQFATTNPETVESITMIFGVSGWSQTFQKKFNYTDEPLSKLTENTWLELSAAKSAFSAPADSTKTWAQIDRIKISMSFRNTIPVNGYFWFDDWKLAGGGKMSGKYQYRWIYVAKSGSLVLSKSNPYDPVLSGVTPNDITVKRRGITVGSMTASTDAQVTHKWIYRSFADNPSAFYYDGEVTNATLTYSSTKSDTELGELLVLNRDVPPAMSDIVGPHYDRIFGISASITDKIVFSRAKEPDAFPVTNYMLLGSPADPPMRIVLFEGLAYVLTKGGVYAIQGTDEDSFVAVKTRAERGTIAKRSVAVGDRGIFFLGTDGVYLFDGLHSVLLSQEIDPVFYGTSTLGIDAFAMSQTSVCRGAFFDGKYFLAYPHTGQTANTRVLVFDEETRRWYNWNFSGVRDLFVEKVNNYLIVAAADGLVYYAENGLKNLVDTTTNSQATILTAFRGAYTFGGYKHTKDLYIDVDAPGAITIVPIIDNVTKPILSLTSTTDRAISRVRVPGYKGRLFEWRLKANSFFRLFGISAKQTVFQDQGYNDKNIASQSD